MAVRARLVGCSGRRPSVLVFGFVVRAPQDKIYPFLAAFPPFSPESSIHFRRKVELVDELASRCIAQRADGRPRASGLSRFQHLSELIKLAIWYSPGCNQDWDLP